MNCRKSRDATLKTPVISDRSYEAKAWPTRAVEMVEMEALDETNCHWVHKMTDLTSVLEFYET